MAYDSVFARKILKDEIRRKVLILLNERGALSFDVLMDILNQTQGMMAYELKVLDDFLVKTDDDKYVLTEKGKLAYKMLSELPENTGVSKRWKFQFGVTVVSLVVVALFAWHLLDFQLAVLIRGLGSALFFAVFLYYLKVKPKTTERLLYILGGVCVLGVLWLFSWGDANAINLKGWALTYFL